MPSNKIFVALILCASAVTSVWLVLRPRGEVASFPNQSGTAVSAEPLINIQNTNDEWKKILTTVNPGDDKITKPIRTSDSSFDDTTLTAQLAKDFLSQYLLLKKSGKTVTPDDAQNITNNALSQPQYTQTTGAVYTRANLHISQSTDISTVRKYYEDVKAILAKVPKNDDDPALIVQDALKQDNAKTLEKIDPIIVTVKYLVSSFINVQVPSDAVAVHLGFLNATSNILSNLEGMRATFTDPVKSFAGTAQYAEHLTTFTEAQKNMQGYFAQKLGRL